MTLISCNFSKTNRHLKMYNTTILLVKLLVVIELDMFYNIFRMFYLFLLNNKFTFLYYYSMVKLADKSINCSTLELIIAL